MKNWLRKKILRWLGINPESITRQLNRIDKRLDRLFRLNKDLVSIGVDVHFKAPHMILVYSRLNGGQLREIKADFKNFKELNDFVHYLKDRFNTDVELVDAPPQLKHFWRP
jgi:hypothetical protein